MTIGYNPRRGLRRGERGLRPALGRRGRQVNHGLSGHSLAGRSFPSGTTYIVRKTPSSHRNGWANSHLPTRPNTLLAQATLSHEGWATRRVASPPAAAPGPGSRSSSVGCSSAPAAAPSSSSGAGARDRASLRLLHRATTVVASLGLGIGTFCDFRCGVLLSNAISGLDFLGLALPRPQVWTPQPGEQAWVGIMAMSIVMGLCGGAPSSRFGPQKLFLGPRSIYCYKSHFMENMSWAQITFLGGGGGDRERR